MEDLKVLGCRSELALPGDLQSLCDVVKRLQHWLKIGVKAGFGPNLTMEFEAAIPKKFGLAYYTGTFYYQIQVM